MRGIITEQELIVLQSVADGQGYAEIAKQLNVSISCIKQCWARLRFKLQNKKTAELIKWGIENGYILVNLHPGTPDLKLDRPAIEPDLYTRWFRNSKAVQKEQRETGLPPACCDTPHIALIWYNTTWVWLSATGEYVDYPVNYCPFCGTRLADVTRTRTVTCSDEPGLNV